MEKASKRSMYLIGGTRELLLGIGTGLLVVYLTSCAGGRLYVGYEAVDEMQITQKLAKNTWTWRCLFVDCDTKEG